MNQKKRQDAHVNRDAINGRFVTDEVAQERPETTVRETVHERPDVTQREAVARALTEAVVWRQEQSDDGTAWVCTCGVSIPDAEGDEANAAHWATHATTAVLAALSPLAPVQPDPLRAGVEALADGYGLIPGSLSGATIARTLSNLLAATEVRRGE